MRFLSLCSGIEAASVAFAPLGWHAAAFAEIEPFPCAVLAHHYPNVPNLGDITRYEEWPDLGTIDLVCGGPPCFVPGTLIATQRGLLPIADVVVGDEVLTHKNRWRRVLAIGGKTARTVVVAGQGQSSGIETTSEHPFYARQKHRQWVGREQGSWKSVLGEPTWTAAKDMKGLMWASPAWWPAADAPMIHARGRENATPPHSEALAWLIGRWVGDGWTRINERRGYAIICCAKDEAAELEQHIMRAGFRASRSEERTTTRFAIASRAFARWLNEHFGRGAAAKTIPTWVFSWELRKVFLQGYLSADGCVVVNGLRLTTVSDKLALGTVLIAHSLGLSASRRLVTPTRAECTIEGRKVTERPFWQVTIYDAARSSVELDGHRWGLVRSVEPGRHSAVFNLEVEEDNSYVADGFVVHNCQSFSVAGFRGGMDDDRGNLTLVYGRILAKYRPRWCLYENVPGLLSSDDGRDFASFLGLLTGQRVEPPKEGWQNTGFLSGIDSAYGVAWRVLDAQYIRVDGYARAVPQRRNRVFVVGCLGDWRSAAAVLLERESLLGDPAPRRIAGARVAGSITGGFGSGGADHNDGQANHIVAGALAGSGPGAGWRLGPDEAAANHCIAIQGNMLGRAVTAGPAGSGISEEGISFTLTKTDVHAVAYGGNNCSGPIEVATARNACASASGRMDFESETFLVQPAPVGVTIHGTCGTTTVASYTEVSSCLRARDPGRSDNSTSTVVMQPVPFDTTQITSAANRSNPKHGDPCHPLTEGGHAPAIAYGFQPRIARNGRGDMGEVASALNAESGRTGKGDSAPCVAFNARQDPINGPINGPIDTDGASSGVMHGAAVRRLTPRECARLQGFPDNYLDITFRGKPASDSVKYKALGNSWACNVARWVGMRIAMVDEITKARAA